MFAWDSPLALKWETEIGSVEIYGALKLAVVASPAPPPPTPTPAVLHHGVDQQQTEAAALWFKFGLGIGWEGKTLSY